MTALTSRVEALEELAARNVPADYQRLLDGWNAVMDHWRSIAYGLPTTPPTEDQCKAFNELIERSPRHRTFMMQLDKVYGPIVQKKVMDEDKSPKPVS